MGGECEGGPPRAGQAALCERARAGDRAAADELFEAVRRLAWQLVHKYAKKFGADPDDLLSVAGEAFCAAVRYYRPDRSKFSTYFATIAGRAMVEHCEVMARRSLPVVDDGSDALALTAAPEADPAPFDLAEALAAIPDPVDRTLFRLCSGLDDGRTRSRDVGAVGAKFGLVPAEARERYRAAFARVSDFVQRRMAG